ncbi:MAG TPA: hypothetical protein VFJ24_07410 [Gaiellales bacterium]|nr:hypothetical protein [Gaiellales bacterium]
MSDPLPEGLDRVDSVEPPRRGQGVWLRRVFIAVLAMYVLLGLANVFGQVTTTSEASSSGADLRVTAPAALRGGLIYQVSIDITARQPIASARLVMSPGWFSGLTTNAMVPQPSQQYSIAGETVFTLGSLQPGDRRTVHIYFQVNPTTVAWERPQTVVLDDGTRRIAEVDRTVNIYP